jgi:hypothetical protein
LVHDGDGVNDEGFQPCSELLVLCELSFDVVAADASLSLAAQQPGDNAREFAEALALAHEATAVLSFKVVPLGKIAHTQARA